MSKPIVYLDQAATARPKADGVADAMHAYVTEVCVNVNRSAYRAASEASLVTLETRERLCALFDLDDPARAILTPGQTWSLNMAISGVLRAGDHALVSPLEHNAVMRPLNALKERGVSFSRVPLNEGGLDLAAMERMFLPNTRLCVITHASNVSGEILPIAEVAALCKRHGALLVIDAAQTAGHYPVSMLDGFDALCIPSHKGLRGPSGVGAMLLSARFADQMQPLVTGGTGSDSDREIQPSYLPDRFEPGTPNLAGIYGLHAALDALMRETVDARRERERALTSRFLNGLKRLKRARVIGPASLDRRVGVVSCDFTGCDNADIADRLATDYNIYARCGLHCAPNAHKAYGTFPQGTVRFSFDSSNTADEIDAALAALREIL